MKRLLAYSLLFGLLTPPTALAKGKVNDSFEMVIASLSIQTVTIASLLLLVLTLIAMVVKQQKEILRKLLFWSMVSVVVVSTLILGSSTVYLNTIAWSKGPVHWHADIQTWLCGEHVEFVDPVGSFSNKIGTPTFHEHNDQRLHLEGVVVEPHDASLGRFFEVIGGQLSTSPNRDRVNMIVVPSNTGKQTFEDGMSCPDGTKGEVQIFAYKSDADTKKYSQEKLSDAANYVMSGDSQVPPGDCIIIEFGPQRAKTDYLCRSYEVALENGRLKGEARGN